MSSILQPRTAPPEPAAPLVEELTPAPDPWDAARRFAHLPHLLFLDSAALDSPFGRYSFLTADPFDWLSSRGGDDNPFPRLAERLARWRTETIPGLPPFQGGAAGLFGYDLCHHIERLPRPSFDEFALPDLAVGFYDWVLAFDHCARRAWLISTGLPETQPWLRRPRAARRLQALRHRLRGAAAESPPDTGPPLPASCLCPQYPLPILPRLTSNFDHPRYLSAVRRAIDYVHAGDCFQVNVAQRLLHPATLPPLELYRRLRERNAAPFAGLFDLGGAVVASASPERFLRVEDGEVETRPIKGTRPRGGTPEEDAARATELLACAKDRAENVMIVDLMRNDLGRVCQYRTVRVPALCRLESYRYVHHLVSEVRGRLRPELGPVDLLKAAFPGGSVTGAPKVRAMEIIAELEPTARGPYCGALGYIGFDGAMDTNILIRSFTIARGWIQFPVGGGIVADSDPQREYEETLHKAEGLVRALR
ncbi:MAG TPA: aminodeoxychorismate synthase component I [Gemmataceae bacterium]|nr:aminodeoxychorismate synthase component I [Gemmataceae bacterium]